MAIAALTLIELVAGELQDAAYVRWSKAKLLGFLNDAQLAVVLAKPDASAVTQVVGLVTGTKQTLPTGGLRLLDVFRNMGPDGETPGRPVRMSLRNPHESVFPTWHTSPASTVVREVFYDDRVPRVYWNNPPVDASDGEAGMADFILTLVTTPAVAEIAEVAVSTNYFDPPPDDGDYMVVTAQDGVTYAVALDFSGDEVEPTGAHWTAIPSGRKAFIDVSGVGTDAALATAIVDALNAITGFDAKIFCETADDVVRLVQLVAGAVADPVVWNANDSSHDSDAFVDIDIQIEGENLTITDGPAAGDYIVITAQDGTTYAFAIDTTGSDPEPTGPTWDTVTYTTQVDISACENEEQMAAAIIAACGGLTGFSDKIELTFAIEIAVPVLTVTQLVVGAVVSPVIWNANDSSHLSDGFQLRTYEQGAYAVTLEIAHSKAPAVLTDADNDNISLDDTYRSPIEEWMFYRAYSQNVQAQGGRARANEHLKNFYVLLGLYTQAAKVDSPNQAENNG